MALHPVNYFRSISLTFVTRNPADALCICLPLEFEYLTGQAEPGLLTLLKTNSMAGIDKFTRFNHPLSIIGVLKPNLR